MIFLYHSVRKTIHLVDKRTLTYGECDDFPKRLKKSNFNL